jgi:hypothetical protein
MEWARSATLATRPFSDLLRVPHLSHSASSPVSPTEYSILHNGIVSWSFGSLKCVPKRRGLNSAEPSHWNRACEVLTSCYRMPRFLYAAVNALSRPSLRASSCTNMEVVPWLRRLVAGLSPRSPKSRPCQFMWDLRWVKWHWERFFSEFFGLTLSVSFHRGFSYSFIIREMNSRPVVGRNSENHCHAIYMKTKDMKS